MLCAVNTMRPVAQDAVLVGTQSGSTCRGIEKRTPCSVSGPEAGPSACCQVSVVPAGKRATICASRKSRPPNVVSNHHANNASITIRASVPAAERIAHPACQRTPRGVAFGALFRRQRHASHDMPLMTCHS